MPKEKLAIVSLLKPIDDVRSFHKMALSLAATRKYTIHLIGYPANETIKNPENIHISSLHRFAPKSLKRLFAPLTVFKKLIQVKPKVVIVNSPELLTVMVLYKILFGCRLLYDIQENYCLNIRYQENYSSIVGRLFGGIIRCLELITSPFVNHYVLAEKCYSEELKFLKNKWTIVENKSILSHRPRKKSEAIKLLFSGTLTASNGVLEAAAIMRQLHIFDSRYEPLIIGHCPQVKISNELEKYRDVIDLKISQYPLPFEQIAAEMQQAHFGLVTYRINPSNQNCMPTKVYDYGASGLPMLFQSNTKWGEWIEANSLGIGWTDRIPNAEVLHQQIQTFQGLKKTAPSKCRWQEEDNKLIEVVDNT